MQQIKQRKYWIDHFHDEKYESMRNKITDSFKDLVFVEGPHKYYLNGKEVTCVSNVTHMFTPKFDTEAMAQATYERNFNKETSKYYQMTPEMIKEQWKQISKDACSLGTDRHLFSECIFYFMTNQLDKIAEEFKDRIRCEEGTNDMVFVAEKPKEEAAIKFWEDLPDCYIPILCETKVYDEFLGYSGTFDLLMYYDAELNGGDKKSSGLLVLDWKTNRDLYKNFNEEKLLSPFEGLLNMPLSVYKLQLSLYQNCLEKIGFKIVGRKLMWLKDDSTYEQIRLESYVKQLVKYLEEHPIKN